ncbi:MAG: aspartate--tRNA ligase [Pseudomonadota bacterium]
MLTSKYRTHTCGELNKSHIGQQVTLSGWVHRTRDHGQVLFIDLRDNYGLMQCVVDSSFADFNKLAHLSNETVLQVTGKVAARSDDTVNQQLATGEVELKIASFKVLSEANIVPFPINQETDAPEWQRLTHRYLDLRRENLQQNIILRSKVIKRIRELMHDGGFTEFQTPILTASSPEGARDFIVPSRLNRGKFYALPQAPQMFKQLFMVAGFDRYFQIAPCFRDEDARADRSPGEFYQLDIEMSFVEQEDVFKAIEPVIYQIFKDFTNKKVSSTPFKRIAYDDAMLKYGSDKPDLRNPIVINDVTDIFKLSEFSIFVKAINKGAVARAMPAPGCADKPRSFFDNMIKYAGEHGAKGLAYICFTHDGIKSPIAKLLSEQQLADIKSCNNLQDGDAVFFSCDVPRLAAKIAGAVRAELGRLLELLDPNVYEFCWITDFPFYEYCDESNKLDFAHNPFSMPQGGQEAITNAISLEDYLAIKSYQYDIVCNGIELSSGAIRNHLPELMYEVFKIVGYSKDEVDNHFGGLIKALSYGAPPHGGIAPGVDRIVMLLAGSHNIREVIAFPLNQQGEDLMLNAPNTVDSKFLRELGIKLVSQPDSTIKV